MKRLSKSLLMALCLAGAAVMGPAATPPEVGEQYILLSQEWMKGPRRENHLSLAEDFLKLSEKSEEYTFKARCRYNAAKIHREAGDREGCIKLLREVIKGFEAPDVHMTVGQRAAFEYCAYALRDLHEMTPPGEERENLKQKLAYEYGRSDAAVHFIRMRGTELHTGAIDLETWKKEVFSFLEATSHFHKRYYSDIVFVLEIAAPRQGASMDARLEICTRMQEIAARHPETVDVESAERIEKIRQDLDHGVVAVRESRLEYESIQELPKIHPPAEVPK